MHIEPTAELRVVRHADARSFLRRAQAWLVRAEAEHNLILGITGSLRDGTTAYEPPYYLATIERGGEIVGCAFRTPPYKLGLTRMPADAARALAEDIGGLYTALPAVLGPVEATQAFATEWQRRTGVGFRIAGRNRIYQLDRVADDLPHVSGSMRTATLEDFTLVVSWIEKFHEDVRMPHRLSDRAYRSRIAHGGIVLWEDGDRVVSLAGSSGPTPHGIRVGPVYTPRELRGHGYATALVAALSRSLLASGRQFCFLYTDLDNPTSNRIYQRIGYRAVADVLDVAFEPGG
jgi:RimJ/RimL family protein N-acetyltransferase